MTRTPALLAASAGLATLVLTGCSSGSSATSASTSGAVTPTTVPTSSDLSSSASSAGAGASSAVSGASSAASSAVDRLTAIRDCLQKANLPTPTSTDARGLVSDIPKLIQDPKVRQALQDCKVSLTG